jgi:hypothetical protein
MSPPPLGIKNNEITRKISKLENVEFVYISFHDISLLHIHASVCPFPLSTTPTWTTETQEE